MKHEVEEGWRVNSKRDEGWTHVVVSLVLGSSLLSLPCLFRLLHLPLLHLKDNLEEVTQGQHKGLRLGNNNPLTLEVTVGDCFPITIVSRYLYYYCNSSMYWDTTGLMTVLTNTSVRVMLQWWGWHRPVCQHTRQLLVSQWKVNMNGCG